MFGFLKSHLGALYNHFTEKARSLFGRQTIDASLYEEIGELLRASDLGAALSKQIVTQIKQSAEKKGISKPEELEELLRDALQQLVLLADQRPAQDPQIIILVGINGGGKTTTAGKLARKASHEGKKVLLVAGDTFRAAAKEQLQGLGTKAGVDVFWNDQQKDPASLVFDGCKKYKDEQYDLLIIDTAGRLQTKSHLMDELAKIKRIVQKQLPEATTATLLTIDSMLGQNSLEQARLFHQATKLDGLIATKMDGTAKGGAIIAIIHALKLPIWFYTFGESLDQIAPFDAQKFVDGFFK
jgi:fused signal recognition particle receptor